MGLRERGRGCVAVQKPEGRCLRSQVTKGICARGIKRGSHLTHRHRRRGAKKKAGVGHDVLK